MYRKVICLSTILLILLVMFLILLIFFNFPFSFCNPVESKCDWFNLGNKFNLIESFNTIGTIISAIGLVWFSYLTFKNQKSTEFENLFQILLNEHNKLMENESFKKGVEKLNEEIVNIIRKYNFKYPDDILIYQELLCKLHTTKRKNNIEEVIKLRNSLKSIYNEENKINTKHELYNPTYQIFCKESDQDYKTQRDIVIKYSDEVINIIERYFKEDHIDKNLSAIKTELEQLINGNKIVKPYLIILFRILKYIKNTEKIEDDDKNEYFGLVRGLIPSNVLFLILFNSYGWSKSNERNSIAYDELLVRAKLFEHLDFNQDWIENIYQNEHIPRIDMISLVEKTAIEMMDKKAFGENVYLSKKI
ncbi:Uncharacterised protein [Suttonella indologenes]|uniref:Phage abortive infection protein n=1 Tax=Suttonella indologenes TaxID=13276 RepID=A0A380MTS2_9GAMM|nr:Uncharacterised protein [Suttonella indologenes]